MVAHATHRCALTLGVLATGIAAVTAQQRTWTDSSGKFSVEAEFVETKQDSVVLKKTSGKLITVPVARLSETDRRYLQSLAEPDSRPANGGERVYPSFPDTMTEVPPWNDANPPFDLAGFLKAPPPEENAESL
jgi:hypothetical protein